MTDDELLQSLHALGRPDAEVPATELSRVRRSIRRRRRLRVGAAASVSTLAVAAAAVGVVLANPSSHVARIQPIRSGPTTSNPADVYAEVLESGIPYPPVQDAGDVVLRSAVDGQIVRVLARGFGSANPPGFAAVSVGPSGRWVYYVKTFSTSLNTYFQGFRVPVGGGTPQNLTGPPAAGGIEAALVPSDDDSEVAWLSGLGGPHGDAVDLLDVSTGHVRDLGYQDAVGAPAGWSPDGRTLYTTTSGQTGPATARQVAQQYLHVLAVPVGDPTAARTVYATTSRARGDNGSFCDRPAEVATVTSTGRLVVVTDGCSLLDPTRVTDVDPTSGRVTASFRLPASFAGAFVQSIAATPTGGVVLMLTNHDCGTTDPVVFVHGTTYTRPSLDDQRCSTAG